MGIGTVLPIPGSGLGGPHWGLAQIPFPYVPYVLRVSVHLQAFKKCLVESARMLAEGQQWLSLVDYSIMAWGYAKVIILIYKIDSDSMYLLLL